jgi:hypothetical protein
MFCLVGFSVLDGIRDTFIQGSAFSYTKEFLIAVGCVAVILFRSAEAGRLQREAILMLFCLAYLSVNLIITTKFMDGDIASRHHLQSNLNFGGWSIVIKVFALIFFSAFLSEVRNLYPKIYAKIPFLYCNWAIVYCVVTVFFIVTGLSKKLTMRNWGGRLSIGYPTMDAIILMIAIIFVIHSKWSASRKFLLIVLYSCVIVMQNTASGYMAIGIYLILLGFILPSWWKLIPISLIAMAVSVFWAIYEYFYIRMGMFGGIIVDKINGFIFGQNTSSVSARIAQIHNLKIDILSNPIGLIFGGGGSGSYYVESQFYAVLGAWGGVGIAFFAIFYAAYFVDSLRSQDRAFRICFLSIFLVGAIPLGGLNLFPFLFHWAYMSTHMGVKKIAGIQLRNP